MKNEHTTIEQNKICETYLETLEVYQQEEGGVNEKHPNNLKQDVDVQEP